MVAADDKYFFSALRQAGNKAVKKRHGFRLGRGTLIDVPGNQHGIRLLSVGNFRDLLQNIFLVVQQGQIVHLLSQVQIGQMKEPHGIILSGRIFK